MLLTRQESKNLWKKNQRAEAKAKGMCAYCCKVYITSGTKCDSCKDYIKRSKARSEGIEIAPPIQKADIKNYKLYYDIDRAE